MGGSPSGVGCAGCPPARIRKRKSATAGSAPGTAGPPPGSVVGPVGAEPEDGVGPGAEPEGGVGSGGAGAEPGELGAEGGPPRPDGPDAGPLGVSLSEPGVGPTGAGPGVDAGCGASVPGAGVVTG
jgi:hypothetical protein